MPHLFNIKSSGVLSDTTTFARQMTGTVANGALVENQTIAVPLSTSYRRLGAFTLAPAESATNVCGLYINLSNIKPTSTLTLLLSSNGNTTSTTEYVLSSIPALSTYSESFYIGLMFDPKTFNGLSTSLIINVSARTSELSGAYYIGTAPAPTTPTVGGEFNKALISTITLPISSSTVLAAEKVNIISHLYDKLDERNVVLGSSNVIDISGQRCTTAGSFVLHGDSKLNVVDVQGGILDSTNAAFLTLNNSSSFIAGTYSSPLTSNFVLNLSSGAKNINLNHSSNFVVVGKDKLSYTYLIEDTLPNISSIALSNFSDNLSSWSVGDTLVFPPNGKSKTNVAGSLIENIDSISAPKILNKTNTNLLLDAKLAASKLSLSTPVYGPNFRGAPILNLTKNITFGPFQTATTGTGGLINAKNSSKIYIKNAEVCRYDIDTIGEVIVENCAIRGSAVGTNSSLKANIAKSLNITLKNNLMYDCYYGVELYGAQTIKNIINNITIDGNVILRNQRPIWFNNNNYTNSTNVETNLVITNNIFAVHYNSFILINEKSTVAKFDNNISYFSRGAGLLLTTRPNKEPLYIQNYKSYKSYYLNATEMGCGIDYRGVNYIDTVQASTVPAISCQNISIIDSENWCVRVPSPSFFGMIDGLTARDSFKGVHIKTNEGPVNIANAFITRNNKTSLATAKDVDTVQHTSTNIVYDVGDCEFTHSVRNSIIGSSEDAYAITLNNSNFLDKLKIDYCDLYSSKINLFLCPAGYPNHKTLVRGNILCSNTNFYYPKTFTFASDINYIPETDGGSVAFDGTNYIKPLSGSHFNLGTGDFTIDGWVNATDTKFLPIIFDTRTLTPSKSGFAFGLDRSWFLEVKIGDNSYKSSKGLFAGLWYHVVLSRTSNVFNIWLNGEKLATFTDSTNFNSEEATLGASFEGENIFTGNLFNFRVTKGESIYDVNGNFDPPSYPVSSNNNTSLLLGAYKHNQIADKLGKNEVISYNNATYSGLESKFGRGSVYFDGTDYSAITFRKSDNFSFGTSNFTIEGWLSSGKIFESKDVEVTAEDGSVSTSTVVSEVTASTRCIFDTRTSGSSTSGFYLAENNSGFIVANSDTTFISTESGRQSGKWQHFALVRDANKLTLFIDGLSSNGGSFDLTNQNFSDSNLTIGGYIDKLDKDSTYFGYMDNFLVLNNQAKYTEDFVPSALLLEDINSSYTGFNKNKLIDSSVNNLTITPVQTLLAATSIRSASPKSADANLYNESLHNGGLYFDSGGSPAIEVLYKPDLFDWWTSDFTLEYFIYPTTFNEILTIADTDFNALPNNKKASLVIGNFSKDSTEFVWSFGHLTDGTATFVYQSVNTGTQQPQRVSSSEKLSAYSWNHVALVKNSSGIRIYVNGIGNTLSAVQFNPVSNSSIPLTIGQHNNTKISDGTIISNLRIVKGTALYSGDTITVPTSGLTSVPNTSLLLKATNGGIIDKTGNCSLLLDGTTRNLFIDTSKSTYGIGVSDKSKKSYAVYNRIYDATGGSSVFTKGGPSVEFISPFNGANPYNPSTHGTSMAFNIAAAASLHKVNSQQTEATNFGTGDFVIDFFAYTTVFIGPFTLFSIQSGDTTATGFRFETNSGQVKLHSAGADKTTFAATPNTTLPLSTWTHLAVARTGNQLKMYKNGVALTPVWTLTTEKFTDSFLTLGNTIGNGTTFRGYISNFRIRKGVGESVISPSTIPTAPLPDDTQCDLLINTFYPDPIVQSTYSPLTSNIVYFDGSSYINAYQERPSIKLGPTDPLTIQMWVKFNDINAQRTLIDTRLNATDTSRFVLERNNTNNIAFRNGGSSKSLVSYSILAINTWYHIAVVIREDKTASLFINGVLEDSGIDATQDLLETFPFKIGASVLGETPIKGYISNLRITKKEEYSTNFIPPTEDILDVDNDTIFTLEQRTDSQKYIAVDKKENTVFSMTNCVAGVSGKYANDGGIWFNKGQLATLDYNPAYNLGVISGNKQQFCVELWFYPTQPTPGTTFQVIIDKNGGFNGWGTNEGAVEFQFLIQTNSVSIHFNNGGTTATVIGQTWNTGTVSNTSATVKLNDWNHLAFTCDGTTYRGYLNGNNIGSSTANMRTPTTQKMLSFGSYASLGNQFVGYMDDIKITKGVPIYTGNTYTVPSAPFDLNTDPNAANVVMLIKSENKKSYRINDVIDSSNNNTPILAGNGISQIKSTPVDPNGWCVYFNGTNDSKITIPVNDSLIFGAVEYTIEFWFYKFKSVFPAGLSCMVDYRNTSDEGLKIGLSGSKLMIAGMPPITSKTLSSFGDYVENAWNHVAISNTGAVIRVFLNGEQRNGDIDAQNTNYNSNSLIIGANRLATPAEEFCGLISNLRIIKGLPLYVGNFTPKKIDLGPTILSDVAAINAKLLLNGDTSRIINGDTILDLSNNNLTLSKILTVYKSDSNPFGGGDSDVVSKPFNTSEHQTDVFREKGIVNSYIGGNPKKHGKYLNSGTIITDDTEFQNISVGFSEKLTPNSNKTRLRSSTRLVALRAYNQIGNYDPDTLSKISVWVKKSSDWSGQAPRLIVVENKSMGVYEDTVLATATGSNDTWIKLEATNVGSVKKNGMLEFYVDCIGVNVGSIWIDDWAQEII